MTTRFDELTDPTALGPADQASIEELRATRDGCQAFESGLSFVRRMIQGRLDIVGAEVARRRANEPPRDSSELIGALPDILADANRPRSKGRPAAATTQPEIDEELVAQLDDIIGVTELARIGNLSDEVLATVAGRLSDLERTVSDYRRAIHEYIDAIQAEVIARYRRGEADVDSLLH